MKKALVVLLAFAFVAGAFADAPVANLDVAEFTGSATVTWGVDLDAEKTGFKNATDASFKVNIVDGGEATTSSDNAVWGEIVVKTDGLSIEQGKNKNGTASIDKAVLHLGPAYLGILADNTKIGAFDAPEAVRQQHKVENVGPDRSQGVVLGFDHDLFNIAFDLRNHGQYKDDYALRGKLGITAVENLDLNVGFSMAFEDQKDGVKDPFVYYIIDDTTPENEVYILPNGDICFMADKDQAKAFNKLKNADTVISADQQKGFGANVAYTLPIGEFYLKPGVGYTNTLADDDKGALAFGVLFGFDKGDTGDDKIGLPYFGDKKKDKGTSGVSVSTNLNLNEKTMTIPLAVGFYAGDLVENLSAAALFTTENVEKVSDNYKFKAALKYAAAVGDGTITPRFGVQNAKDELKLTIGAEFAGFVDNTTFDAVWESKNLSADPAGKGTINASIKIAL